MSDKIKLQEILTKWGLDNNLNQRMAIEEVVEAVVDKCEQNVKIRNHSIMDVITPVVIPESILQVKQMIDYETIS